MMMRVVLVSACAVAVLGLPAAAGTVLLADDFSGYESGSSGAPLWAVYSGSWRVTEEGFEGADCEGGYAAMGARTGRREWADYTLSLRLKVLSRGSDWRDGPWIGIRHRNSAHGYTVGFYTRMTALHKASSGTYTEDGNPLAQSPATIRDDAWHAVAITVAGGDIAVRLDGKTIIEAADEDWNGVPRVASGGIVLAARKWEGGTGATRVLFDDVRVEAAGRVPDSLELTRANAAERLREKSGLLDFIQSRRERRYAQTPREVLAFYYTWYGRPERHGEWVHWRDVKPEEHDIASSTHYPAKGAYDSHDPEMIDWHIDLAKQHGVTGFICTWWGQGSFDDRALAAVLERAAKKDFKVSVYWETAPGKGAAQVDQAVNDLLYILKRHGAHPAFLKLDGKPVIFVYGRVMGQVPLNAWPAIINGVRADHPADFVLVADGFRESFARVFDGVHTYNICGWVKGKAPDTLRDASAKAFSHAVALARRHGKISCITIIPGYDDTKIRTPGLNAERQDGQTYRVLWEEAIAADPDWVIITSWNEWHEGSEIEPSREDGDTYIKLTGEYAARFMAAPRRAVEPAATVGLDPEKARALCARYQGRTIGILPDYGSEAVFWLADAGITLRELTWEQVLDPSIFNPQELPLVLFAGGEGFVQNLKTERDVEQALERYLGEGGFLMVIPCQPFPFYYNENHETVVAAGRLGFPIVGSGAQKRRDIPEDARVAGWESPPEGVELAFRLDTEALPGLPGRAPFPAAGDLRWRPATAALIAADDTYIPLATLKDAAGRSYGDGIAYIEHTASEPRNGKNLYVWMRMPDLCGANELLFALFRFAAERLE